MTVELHDLRARSSLAVPQTVFLKCENFQRVGAFKFRGAYNAVTQRPSSKLVVALSSGNHVQGIALACRLSGSSASYSEEA